jgi:DNA mismatch repair protein MSH4
MSIRQYSRPPTGIASMASRPWTDVSRPKTARPQTALSTKYEATYMIALLEGRGVAREVGVAALDKETGRVTLVQVCDFFFLFVFYLRI